MSGAVNRAVLLVGGRGSRLAPFTATFPKPLMPLGNVPVLEVVLSSLIDAQIKHVTLALGHLGELIQAYLLHRPHLLEQIEVDYVREDQPLGTAGALSLIDSLDETFITMNGDLLTDADIGDLVRFHREQGAALTIATQTRQVNIDLGVIHTGPGSRVVGYSEKPTHNYTVSMGIYVYEPSVLQYIKPGKYLDFPELVQQLIDAGEHVAAYESDCLWLDIGRPDDYARAQEIYRRRWDGESE